MCFPLWILHISHPGVNSGIIFVVVGWRWWRVCVFGFEGSHINSRSESNYFLWLWGRGGGECVFSVLGLHTLTLWSEFFELFFVAMELVCLVMTNGPNIRRLSMSRCTY